MKTERYSSHTLRKLLKAQKIASMSELKEALGTPVDVTVFRKLVELGYRTSYSNRGQYYTLEQIPEFDKWGLWSFRAVYFSERDTLRATAEALVDESEKGFFATELWRLAADYLHVIIDSNDSPAGFLWQEISPFDDFPHQNTEPDFNLIHSSNSKCGVSVSGPLVYICR